MSAVAVRRARSAHHGSAAAAVNERRRTLSNTAYSTLGLYAEYLLGLVASILVARELGPAELGIYGLVVWIVATAVVVANAGITTAAIKFVAELRGGGHEALVPALVPAACACCNG